MIYIHIRGFGVKCHFQRYFSYIVVVSFIVEGKQRKPVDLSQITDKLDWPSP